jgi:hypothetical protein
LPRIAATLLAAGTLACSAESPDPTPPPTQPALPQEPTPRTEPELEAADPRGEPAPRPERESDREDPKRESDLRERLRGGNQDEVQEEVRHQLQSGYAADREEALRWVDLTRETIPVIVDILLNDPTPEVRVQAADSLTNVTSHEAVAGLLQALSDPDSRVVLMAIEGLVATGDQTLVEQLAPLLDDANAEVRQAALEAIEFLE